PRALVESVVDDDSEALAYFQAHRHLFVPLGDLERAAAALERRITAAKLAGNPLYIDLDASAAEASAARDSRELDDLRAPRRDAERRLTRSSNVSEDRLTGMIQIGTSFRATDAGPGAELVARLHAIRDRVVAQHPGIRVGFTGGAITAVAEHDAIFKGMVLS